MGNILDVVFCIILICAVISGFRSGFIRSFVEFAGSLFALVASSALAGLATDSLCVLILKAHQVTRVEYLFLKIIVMVILFVALESLAHLCAGALDTVFHLPLLHQLNAVLGGVFGLFKGGVMVVLLCVLLQAALPMVKTENVRVYGEKMCTSSRIYCYVSSFNPLSHVMDISLSKMDV